VMAGIDSMGFLPERTSGQEPYARLSQRFKA